MLRLRARWNARLWAVALACAAAGAGAQEPKPEEVLKSLGLSLKRGSSTYVLAGESEVQAKLAEAQRVFRLFNSALMRQAEIAQEIDDQKGIVRGMLQERIVLNQQLRANNQQDVIQHNQIVSRLNEINDQLHLLDGRGGDAGLKQDIDKGVSQRRGAYIQLVLDLRQLVDSTTRQYVELARNDSVKKALDALGAKSKSPPKLGPSRGFDENVKQLTTREKSVLSQAIEMRRTGGVYEVDVTFNGRETTPMVFDTGASLIMLSAEFATKIGLSPQATDSTIQLHDAAGGITPAKKMTIPSVRVGPFTVENVACAVMPADKRGVPLLLGQSFISQFTHKVDNGRLVLSKVETPEPRSNSTRNQEKTKKRKRSNQAVSGTNAPAAANGSGSPF